MSRKYDRGTMQRKLTLCKVFIFSTQSWSYRSPNEVSQIGFRICNDVETITPVDERNVM